ncbi:MAG: FAD-binding protein, partial [Bacteroidota bacterium]|nr:FAD-binding protein [Bacteroidota bacterium]
MQQIVTLKLPPELALTDAELLRSLARKTGLSPRDITGFNLLKKSIDARGKSIWIHLTLQVFSGEPFSPQRPWEPRFRQVGSAQKSVIIIGSGPAGLFAALQLIELGIRPIILERGKTIRARRRDLAALNRQGDLDPDSNYCFGEGGAGTYSDGKLYTRSTKRGDVSRILKIFVHFGAHENILYEAHPHIGTNKLPQIITAIHKRIEDCGGACHFEKKVVDFVIDRGRITRVITAGGDEFSADAFILATGHSARDIFELLDRKKITLEAKPFALGVRAEHPQELINLIQYGEGYPEQLPPASYSLVEQIDQRGVFSFCMCPGGIIAPASTGPGELVVNGWSPSRRNNPYANSGMVVQVAPEEVIGYLRKKKIRDEGSAPGSPLYMMEFQRLVEQAAFAAGGGRFIAPAQRMTDFVDGRVSGSLP